MVAEELSLEGFGEEQVARAGVEAAQRRGKHQGEVEELRIQLSLSQDTLEHALTVMAKKLHHAQTFAVALSSHDVEDGGDDDDGGDDRTVARVRERSGSSTLDSSGAGSGKARALSLDASELQRIKELPSLMNKIDEMGLSEEYAAYRERYLAWRTGAAEGAKHDLNSVDLPKLRQQRGFGFWYPSMEVWQWRRTLSYWIAVTFFEGSLFFTISSFMYCYVEDLGRLKGALTKWGYVGGKINFIICTYLMCIETINLTADHDNREKKEKHKRFKHSESEESVNSSHSIAESDSDDSLSSDYDASPSGRRLPNARRPERFYLNPLRARRALHNLEQLGAGPWPYWASLIYFLGVGAFTVGLACEFMSFLPHEVEEWALLISFLIGSLMFLGGGLMECVENEVFTTFKTTQGWWGAFLNTLGGLGFTVGAILGFCEGWDYVANFSYGVGSVIFALGSGVMILMWKDEQFGLTFLAVLNDGPPSILNREEVTKAATFSVSGTIFIMIYCLAAALSTYCLFISLTIMGERHRTWTTAVAISNAFNAFLPCLFAHLMLALNSAVIKTPKMSPFRQLYILARALAIFMVVNSLSRMVEGVYLANYELNHPHEPFITAGHRPASHCALAELEGQ
eukprot:symbB.v1.2.027968.t1/scaffold2912.1/size67362/1